MPISNLCLLFLSHWRGMGGKEEAAWNLISSWLETTSNHYGDWGTGASLLWGKTETVQSGAEKAQGDHANVQKFLKEGCKEDRARLFPMVPKWQGRRQWPQTGKQENSSEQANTVTWEWCSTVTSCPMTWWCLQPQRCSKALWTRPWAAGCKLSCLSRGLDQMTFRDPCQPHPICVFLIVKILLCYQLHFSHKFKTLHHPRGHSGLLSKKITSF